MITLVVFFSAEERDGPMSLHEMLNVEDEEILSLVENYRIHLIAPAYLNDRELDKFHFSLKEVLSFIKYSTDKQQLEKEILIPLIRKKKPNYLVRHMICSFQPARNQGN